ncbi:hypothetical protein MIR68_007409 [Amoeboaphelidium protococcarum]|nr:hypothetical protein MIR68_007409 [Amoeboaphelidium protococcarum]
MEDAKKAAAEAAFRGQILPLLSIDHKDDSKSDQVKKRQIVVGIGSGSTVPYLVPLLDNLAEQLQQKYRIVCIPTSYQSQQLIAQSKNLQLGTLMQYPQIDITIDGADQVFMISRNDDFNDKNNMSDHYLVSDIACIKGGGGCLLQEKIVASASRRFVLIADDRKLSPAGLCSFTSSWQNGIPIEVVPAAAQIVLDQLLKSPSDSVNNSNEQRVIGRGFQSGEESAYSTRSPFVVKQAVLRSGSGKAGPVVTDSGNFIIDIKIGSALDSIEKARQLELYLLSIIGVVEVGLFVCMANSVYIASTSTPSSSSSQTDSKVTLYRK